MGVNPSLIWFGTIPLVAIMLTGIRTGFYWSLFSALLSYTSMVLTRKFGYTYNEFNSEQWSMVATSNMIVAPILYFGTFAYIYNKKDQKIEFNQKFADVGKSSAFVMHEISKPINRIIQKNCNIEDEIKSIVDIYSLSESIRNNQFKDIVLVKIHLLEIINSTLEKYRTYIDFFGIQVELSEIDIYIESDIKFLSIIIDNVIRNAIEACSELTQKKYIRITVVNRELLFENSASEQQFSSDQLLSPMQSSKPGHLGVGLYIVKNLMNALKGELIIDNKSRDKFQIRLKLLPSSYLSA
jgi:signal transduction histidine kinase